jgi:hypothetical protein
MATQVPVALVNAGLALPADRKQRLICQAFNQAIKVYCQKPKIPNRGKFNEYFFDALNNLNGPNKGAGQALAASIAREAPIISGNVCGLASNFVTNPIIGNACTVATNGYAAAAAAIPGAQFLPSGLLSGATAALVPSSLGVGAARTAWSSIFQNGCHISYPDGLIGNRTLELKGPFDSYRKGQAKANHQFNKHQKGFYGSGQKCGKSAAYKSCPR